MQIMDNLLAPGGITIVDPAMADHGKLYSGFDDAYARQIGQLCRRADIILPNVTEAAILSGQPCADNEQDEYRLLKNLNHRCAVLTGADFSDGQTGVILGEGERFRAYRHRRVGGGCHGTGDIFAAAFTGALVRGKDAFDAARIGADFTCRCIENTVSSPAHWYGVKFEPVLPELMAMLA